MAWLVPLALLHGLLYLFLLPPWQHYDEPKHFEYAAQIAAGDDGLVVQARLSREIADSMYRHRFWPDGVIPDILGSAPAAIGESQRVHPPLYYALAAQVIGPLRLAAIETQLYAGRLLSLAFYVLTVLICWRMAVVVVPDEPRIQIALPLLALLAPAFVDLMTALNSDVLVNFCAAAALLGCALLIRDGPRPVGLALALLGLAGALLAKRTAVVAVVPCGLALFWAVRRRPLPWWAYVGGLLGAGLVCALIGLRLDGEAGELRVGLRPWLVALDQTYLRINIEAWLRSVTDLERSLPLYPGVLRLILESFWARLAWGHIDLGPIVDLAVLVLFPAAVLGVGVWLWRSRGEADGWQRRWVIVCLIAVGCGWLATLARLHPIPADGQWSYLPRGRYMFWGFLPTVWLIALGWQTLIPARWRWYGPYLLIMLFGTLDLVAVISLVRYYYTSSG